MFSNASHEQIKPSIDGIGASIAIFERTAPRDWVLVSANELFTEISGKEGDGYQGSKIEAMFPRYLEKEIRFSLQQCMQEQVAIETELIVDREGKTSWWRCIYSPILTPSKQLNRVILTSVEITEKKLLERKLEVSRQRFEAVIEAAYDGVISIDSQHKIRLINQAAKKMFAAEGDELIGLPIDTLIPPRYRERHPEFVESFKRSPVMSRPMQERAMVTGLRRDGTEFPIEITIAKIKIGDETEMTAVIRDVTERSRLIEELRHSATIDHLTGIFNRRYADKAMNRELKRAKRFGRPLSLILFDLDRFKHINDRYGHQMGDQVLQGVVVAAQKIIRDIDVFCRWGGEEFILMLPETDLESARVFSERIRSAICEITFSWLSVEDIITASFGLTTSVAEDSIMEILKRADDAMYEAKDQGRNKVVVRTIG